jgi:hypothetical protein
LQRSSDASQGGAKGSENAGMSSVKVCEKHIHRKPEVSYATLIDVGLVGPKPRPKGVGDGQPVNIPVPPPSLSLWGTQSGKLSVPTGHGASLRPRLERKWRGDPKRLN